MNWKIKKKTNNNSLINIQDIKILNEKKLAKNKSILHI